ncbi:unnamed protein product [Owenia fusiformis]|uniref:Uncharacterized protein n=1 Tax=Owenia fusiformis TaxID=6347 RepID=A0A8J1UP78_OWEFU|nr:unnamed protein product [Owenia fusiformis]
MTKTMNLFLLLNICIALAANRSATYLKSDDLRLRPSLVAVYDRLQSVDMSQYNDSLYESMGSMYDTIASTVKDIQEAAMETIDDITEATTNLGEGVVEWANQKIHGITKGMGILTDVIDEWYNETTYSISMTTIVYINDTLKRMNELMNVVAQCKFGTWFIKNDPFKGRDLYERCTIHIIGILCIIAFSIKVFLVETERLRYTHPKPDDYQAYCRHLETLLCEDDNTKSENSKPTRTSMPKYGWNKHQRRGMMNVTNKQIKKTVIQRQQKEREIKKRTKTQSIARVWCCIYGL